jgi:hypothetical protein
MIVLLVGATAARSAAQPAPKAKAGPRSAAADSLRYPRPFTVMLRAAAVPGWGQVTNHKYVKAGLVVAGEGLLVFEALQELKRENQAVDRQTAILASGGDPQGADYVAAGLDRDSHRNRKISWIWFGIAAHLLSMADAYVDAHLASFETDFGPPESAVDPGEKPRLTFAYRTRF